MAIKTAEVATLISNKVDFRHKLEEQKESHFILINGKIHQEEIAIDLYVPNVSAPNFIKHTLLDVKAQITRHHNCNPSYSEGGDQEYHGSKQAGAHSSQNPISKIPNTKKGGKVSQVVQQLPSKCDALSSGPSTTKEKEREQMTPT
jgi:hypothetical protein